MVMSLNMLGLLFWLVLPAQADVQAAADSPSSDRSSHESLLLADNHPHADTLRAIVEALGASDFDARRQAAYRLRSIGSEAYGALGQGYRVFDDYEIRLRIQEVTKKIFFDETLLDQNGFLGVELREVGGDHPLVEPGHSAMLIRRVVPGTAADRAELRTNDLIVQFDDDALEGIITVTEFSQTIRDAGPGAMMRLGLFRGDEFMEIEVVLGRRPIEYYRNQGDLSYLYMLMEAEIRFSHFWQGQFDPAHAAQQGGEGLDPPAASDAPQQPESAYPD